MENHPIPQDVTGFQFKLIGNMTIKQFAYVCCGVILAVILYYFPLQSALGVLIKTIFIPLLGGSGFAMAFLPIEGRPIDVMAANFLKALFYPNQYIYQKAGRLLSFTVLPTSKSASTGKRPVVRINTHVNKEKQLQALLGKTHLQVQNKLDQKEESFLQSLSSFAGPSSGSPAHEKNFVPQLQLASLQTFLTPKKQEQPLPQLDREPQLATHPTHQIPAALSTQQVSTPQPHMQKVHGEKQQLEKELQQLQQTPVAQPATTILPPPQPASQPVIKQADLPRVPDTPNVIVGIVKDPRGNVLPNMLVEVKDKDGNPVRAFKTNPLGQFASATPLAPGNYTVELEDPKKQNMFQRIQLVADNRILLPIEIVSHDAREELRKQLFN